MMFFPRSVRLVLLSVLVGVALTQLTFFFDPPKSIAQEATPMPTFPTVTGRNIDGESYTLPADFAGDYNLVLLAYTQQQQTAVNTWIPALREAEANTPGLAVYELPTLPRMNWFMRAQTDYWMSTGISDPVARATTITLYTDLSAMLAPLGVTNRNEIDLFLVDRDGNIYWHERGTYTAEKLADLLAQLETVGAS